MKHKRVLKHEAAYKMKKMLIAINSQYIHTNLAVRSIQAYCAQNGVQVEYREYTINQRFEYLLEKIYSEKADALLFSCYIWNVEEICMLAKELRKVLPNVIMAIGGPQVSYNSAEFLEKNPAFDAVIVGEGELASYEFLVAIEKQGIAQMQVNGILTKLDNSNEAEQEVTPSIINMDEIPFLYSEEDMASGKILYYESMRGCPFRCSYCLSSVEKGGMRFKSTEKVLEDLAKFLQAKVKQVKFVDRTFNCKKEHAMKIWRFLQENDNGVTNFHFELAGELLDDETINFLNTVRAGLFQFEIGVQTTNEGTLKEIDRFLNLELLFTNIKKLQKAENIHLHLDLIAGLPWEDDASFVQSFNDVYAKKPDQFQVGILKVLNGSGMERNAEKYGLVWQNKSPFEVLYTKWLNYDELLKNKQVAEMVEMFYNSGRFSHLTKYLCEQFATPYEFYAKLADFYYAKSKAADSPLSKTGYYQLLGDFMYFEDVPQTEHAQWLCQLDMALHEKIKKSPQWVKVGNSQNYRKQVLEFYAKEENILQYLPEYAEREPKQIFKMAHVEVFPFNPKTREKKETAVLFNYAQRDILGKAKIYCIELAE